MSLWIRTLCRRPLGDQFAAAPLQAELNRLDYATMAENQGLDEEDGYAAEEMLRIDSDEDDPSLLFSTAGPRTRSTSSASSRGRARSSPTRSTSSARRPKTPKVQRRRASANTWRASSSPSPSS